MLKIYATKIYKNGRKHTFEKFRLKITNKQFRNSLTVQLLLKMYVLGLYEQLKVTCIICYNDFSDYFCKLRWRKEKLLSWLPPVCRRLNPGATTSAQYFNLLLQYVYAYIIHLYTKNEWLFYCKSDYNTHQLQMGILLLNSYNCIIKDVHYTTIQLTDTRALVHDLQGTLPITNTYNTIHRNDIAHHPNIGMTLPITQTKE